MILKLEDGVFGIGSKYEYINSDNITRIRLTPKRIRIWVTGKMTNYYVGRTKHNMEELHQLDKEIE